jgi:hypothetical protein
VFVAGSGFGPNVNIATVKLGTATITTNPSPVVTNSAGGFGGVSFTVPSVSPPTYALKVTDAVGNVATVQFTVT